MYCVLIVGIGSLYEVVNYWGIEVVGVFVVSSCISCIIVVCIVNFIFIFEVFGIIY